MKNSILRKSIVIVLSLGLLITSLLGCGSSNEKTQSNDNNANTQSNESKLSGSILSLGSSALMPLAQEAAKNFMAKNPGTDVQVQGGGSGNGLTAVSNGTAQIGNSDIFAEEKSGIDAKALEDHKVCVVGFAAIVNPKVKVDNLTKAQLIDVFTGKITNWKEVGGDDLKIVLVNRPASSGTRATFKKYALDGKEEASGQALTEDNNGTVLKTVADTEGAISYLAIPYLDTTVKALKLDGVEATNANIMTGKYSVWSYEHMYTKGPATGLAKAFIDYILSSDCKEIINKLKYIPMSEMKVTR